MLQHKNSSAFVLSCSVYFVLFIFILMIVFGATRTYAEKGGNILDNSVWLHDPKADEKIAQGQTAFIPLDDAFIGIASRLYLIRRAQQTIDLQYYIWENDYVGNLVLNELLHAADRGVKVRLLLDDQNGSGLDENLKALAAHPNFEIKFFNVYKFRKFRLIDYLFRTKKINHRMHNKLIISDHRIAVTGGRNISSEYFDASYNFQFTDLDVLFFGDAAIQAQQVIENFWTHELSTPAERMLGNTNKSLLDKLRIKYQRLEQQDSITQERLDDAQSVLNEALQKHQIEWATAHFVADKPIKARGQARGQDLIYNQMIKLMGTPKEHLELVSAYFVPTQVGADALSALSQDGVRVRVLTNSFVANDVGLIHAFYSPYRKQLLKNGVKLYEFKPNIERSEPTWYERVTGRVIPAREKNNSSLHAKFFDIDGKVFIGSFNFDPRSARLNTEVGLVVESDELQDQITETLDSSLPEMAYEVKLDDQGNLIWIENIKDGQPIIHKHDPQTTRFQRGVMRLIGYLPIEWMM